MATHVIRNLRATRTTEVLLTGGRAVRLEPRGTQRTDPETALPLSSALATEEEVASDHVVGLQAMRAIEVQPYEGPKQAVALPEPGRSRRRNEQGGTQ